MRDTNIFGKKRGRFDEDAAMCLVRGNVNDCICRIRAMSDEDLDKFIEKLNQSCSPKNSPSRPIKIQRI